MIFKRRPGTDPEAATVAFWAWWVHARPRAGKLIGGAADTDLVEEMGRHVAAIHHDLEWGFTEGTGSAHRLVVTAAGDAELRSLAERWRRAGPEPDQTFGYGSSRLGSPAALEATMEFDGYRIDLGGLPGTRRGKPIVVLTQVPLRSARWPGHDLHIRIDVPYRSRDDDGFPAEDTFPALSALEDRFEARADGAVVVAHETCAGIRTTHLYPDRPAAAPALEPLFAGWPDGRIRMRLTPDPLWEEVAHLAGEP